MKRKPKKREYKTVTIPICKGRAEDETFRAQLKKLMAKWHKKKLPHGADKSKAIRACVGIAYDAEEWGGE